MQTFELEPNIAQQSLTRRLWNRVKTWLIASTILGLLSMNGLTLVSDSIHNALFGGVKAVLASVIEEEALSRLLRHSPTAKRKGEVATATRVLTQENATLAASKNLLEFKHAALEKEHAVIKEKHVALEREHAAITEKHVALGKEHAVIQEKHAELTRVSAARSATTKQISKRLATRAVRNAARNSSSVFAEVIPGIGYAVVLGVTALDLHDACETLKDMNELNRAFDHEEVDQAKVCGLRVPKKAEVVAKIKEGPRAIYNAATAALKKDGVEVEPTPPEDSKP
jgi:hypothetical protein